MQQKIMMNENGSYADNIFFFPSEVKRIYVKLLPMTGHVPVTWILLKNKLFSDGNTETKES